MNIKTKTPSDSPYMGRIDTLVYELCPDGVEMVTLGSLGKFENIGVDKKSVENEQNVVLLNYTDVYHHKYINSSIPQMIVTASDKKRIACNVLKGDIFVTPTSETVDDIGHSSVITEDISNCVYSYHIMRYRLDIHNMITSLYINYMFDLNIVKQQVLKKAQGLTRFGLSKDKFASIEIPLPPLSIQQEIVSVLDSFTTLIDKMKQEVEKRKKHMEYYREKLLTFEDGECEWKTLGETTGVSRGKRVVRKDLLEFGSIPVYQNSLKPLGFANESNYPANTPFIISAGAAGEVGYSYIEYWGADDCFSILCENINSRYIYHWLKIKEPFLQSRIRGGAIKRLSRDIVDNLPIPIVSINCQREIVSTLDKFESYISKLEKMIALRQKQYEYYREQLLTFE